MVGLLAYPFFGFLVQRLLSNMMLVSLACFAVGFLLPDFWLYNRIKERQRAILNTLPDVLDLLMVCVEAGLGFDSAVARVAEQEELERSPLHQELMRMHLEVRAGRPREEALRSLGDRCGIQEVRSMVSAFIQSDRLGTPLGKTLRVHAESRARPAPAPRGRAGVPRAAEDDLPHRAVPHAGVLPGGDGPLSPRPHQVVQEPRTMTQPLASLVRVGAVLVACLALWATPSSAQDTSAEVRTWAGQSWRLAQPSLEVFYTIPAPAKGGPTRMARLRPAAVAGVNRRCPCPGPLQALESFFDSGPGPRQGHRQAEYITIRRGAVETRLPLASITSLTFTRQPVSGSSLPPYLVRRHFRYAATAVLTDGSRVEGDYINLGTLILRGQTAEGRLDISWEDIESVRFQR